MSYFSATFTSTISEFRQEIKNIEYSPTKNAYKPWNLRSSDLFFTCSNSVFQFSVHSVHLYYLFPSLEEGGLATYRTAIVQNQHLAMLAKVSS